MKPYAELLEFNQPNPIRTPGYTRIRDQFPELRCEVEVYSDSDMPDVIGSYYDPERISEFAGRWDYGEKNAAKLGQPTKLKTITLRNPDTGEGYEYEDVNIIKKWIASGEQSMLEMAHATVFFECSRVVTHELVRHRLASYQQESQRFSVFVVDDIEAGFFIPPDLDEEYVKAMVSVYGLAADKYNELLAKGVSKQIARYVLPSAARTRIIVSANLREWRHIFKLRLDKSAQPEMREMMGMAYAQMLPIFPQSLEGITEEGRGIR